MGWAKDVRRRSLAGYFGPADNVTVEIRESDALYGLYGMLGIDPEARELRHPAVIRWNSLPNEIKEIATPSKKMEEIRGKDFLILVCESRESGYGRTADAWTMRREFLKMKQDPWVLVEFLRKWGTWDEKQLGSSNLAPSANSSIQNFVVPDEIWELQSIYREALLRPPDEWLCNGVDPFKGAYATPMYPHFILEHHQCRPAIEATITIDLLKKVKFRKCKRPDCSEVFALESRHKRAYCGQPCAHLESVRKQRRAAAKLKKKSATKKGA
jgi:hypothetical protein